MKVKVWVCTNKVGSKSERIIDVDVDDDMTSDERESSINEQVNEFILSGTLVEWGWKEVE